MNEVNLQRKDGWLDLDKYLEEYLGRPLTQEEYNDQTLLIDGLIEPNVSGNHDNYIITIGDEKVFYKSQEFNSDEAYAELFAEEISKVLDIPTAHYDLAILRGKKGVISYNFVKEYDTYYPGTDIILDFYERNLENNAKNRKLYNITNRDSIEDVLDKLNNLEDIWCILEERFKEYHNKEQIVFTIVDRVVDKLIFDILTVNIDDHTENWGILDDIEEGKMLSPQFDNARILNLHRNILVEKFASSQKLHDKELYLTVDNSKNKKPLDVLKHFLDISSSEYRDRVIDKVVKLQEKIEVIPNIIEERTYHPMPKYLKGYFITTMNDHLQKVNEVIYDTKGKNK